MPSLSFIPQTLASNSPGDAAWTNMSNVQVYSVDPASSSADPSGGATEYFDMTGLGATLPAGCTIDGVEVQMRAGWSSGTGVPATMQLIIGGSRVGENKSVAIDSNAVDPANTLFEIGGPADLWSNSISVDDVNASDFGYSFRLGNDHGSETTTAEVVFCRVTIYYTPAASPSTETVTSTPTTFANVADGDTSVAWSIDASLGARNDSSAARTYSLNYSTDQMQATGFDFSSIPSGATIHGVAVTIHRVEWILESDLIVDGDIHLLLAGVESGGDFGDHKTLWPFGGQYPTSGGSDAVYGGDNFTGGLSLTVADVQHASFGVSIKAQMKANGGASPAIDYIEMTVYYEDSGGGGGSVRLLGGILIGGGLIE